MSIAQLIEHFDSLVNQTSVLCSSLRQNKFNVWVPLTKEEALSGLSPINKACNGLQDFWYQDGQDGRETRSSFGLVPATEQQLTMAHNINIEKEHFKNRIKVLQKSNKEDWLILRGELGRSHATLRKSLKYSGLSRLHIKQTWRHIPILDRTPVRAGFNWYQSGRSIQKFTVKQAQDALMNLDISSDHIQTQLSLLNTLNANTPLAKIQNLAPTMRSNVFFDDGKSPSRQAMNVSLPILYLANENGELPFHNEPELNSPNERKRKVRSDRVIEDHPFLPSIRVHRYINN